VSEDPGLRGGGNDVGKVWGRYAVAVCMSRLDERCAFPYEENRRRDGVERVVGRLRTQRSIVADDVTGDWKVALQNDMVDNDLS
jgi:hypothetical protein